MFFKFKLDHFIPFLIHFNNLGNKILHIVLNLSALVQIFNDFIDKQNFGIRRGGIKTLYSLLSFGLRNLVRLSD